MNKAVFLGRVTTTPKINMIDSRKMARFTVAVRRKFTGETDFISCVAWGHNADFAEKNFSKGKSVSVIGEIRTSKYERDGKTNYSTCILVEEISFINSEGDRKERGQSQ